jgi:hypothetical protein
MSRTILHARLGIAVKQCVRTRPLALALWIGLLVVAQTANAGALARITAALPDVPAPPQGSVHWVARSMRLNGLPMTLRTFESRLAPAALFNYYEGQAQRWGHNELRRETRGAQQLLSIRSPRYLITIEAIASVAGSEGTILVSDPPERIRPVLVSRFPHPATARLVNCQEYEDDGIAAEHLSFASTRAPRSEAQSFVEELTRAGWQVLRHAPTQKARGVIIEAQRGAQLASVTLAPDQSRLAATSVVVVWRKS